jgi:hypothetical protein
MKRPLRHRNVDITLLVQSCEDFIDFLEADDYHEDKIENYVNDIFGKAMSAIYGKDIFNYINSKIE